MTTKPLTTRKVEALLASDRHPILTPPTLFSLLTGQTGVKIQFHIKTATKKKENYIQTGLYRINLITANTDAKEIKTSMHFHIPPVRVVLPVIRVWRQLEVP